MLFYYFICSLFIQYNWLLFFIDYILAYEINTDKDSEWQEKREEKRREFEANLEKAKLELEAEGIEVHKFCLMYTEKGKLFSRC